MPFKNAEYSVKGYVDDITIISNDIDAHVSVLQTVDQRVDDLDLSFKAAKCVSYLFDGIKHLQKVYLCQRATLDLLQKEAQIFGKAHLCFIECH